MFWDTMLGIQLAKVLTRNLPSIAESLSAITKPAKRTQHAKVVYDDAVEEYLNEEFEKGRVFVSATQLDFRELGCKVLVITE